MINKNIIKSSLFLSALLLTTIGCSDKQNGVSIDNNGSKAENFKELNDKKQQNEKTYKIQNVNTQNSSVSKVLELLSDDDVKTHILVGDDLLLPSKKYKVTTIRDLQQFVEMFSNMKLVKEAESERLVKWKLVTHELNPFNKKYKMDLSGTDIKLNEIMKQIGIATGYSIIPKKDVAEEYEKNMNLEFNGETIKDFTDYISKYSNLYVEIDHRMKTITLSKFKHTIFDVPVSTSNMELNKEISSGTGTADGGFGGGTISTKSKQSIDIFDELDKYLSVILTEDLSMTKTGETNKNTYFIQRGVGKVYINADPVTMAKVTEVVNNFKSNLEISINVNVAVYTVDLTDKSSYGIDWQFVQNGLGGLLQAGNTSNIMTLATGVAPTGANLTDAGKTGVLNNTIAENSGVVGGVKKLGTNSAIGAILNLAGNYGKISDIQKFNVSTMNNFPTVQVISKKNPYLKSITSEIVANDTGNNTVVTTPEFGEVDSGIFFYINAKTFKDSDKISIDFSPMFNKLEGFETINYGNNESSSQPVTSLQSFNNKILMNDGEQLLITGIITDKKGSTYKGMNPLGGSTPAALNALTGTNGTDDAKQEIFIILTASKEKK